MRRSHALARMAKRFALALLAGAVVTLAGCGGLVENDTLPDDVQDPDLTQTPEGALTAYHGVRAAFRFAFEAPVLAGALLTDEFGSSTYGAPVLGQPEELDRRYLPEGGGRAYNVGPLPGASGKDPYRVLQRTRGQANEAIGLLATYAPNLSPALRAHAYALAGYAEILLADLYCSGIPLSTVDFDGDFTLRPGSPTEEVYRHALALFDTALTLAADSVSFAYLSQLGRGRALLALDSLAEASQAVTSVPDGFSYVAPYHPGGDQVFFAEGFRGADGFARGPGTMTDHEGTNGLPYVSSRDPRVAVDTSYGQNEYGFRIYIPAKYFADVDGDLVGDAEGSIVVADWIEARLIEAEAALRQGDAGTWLAKLNHLRRTAWPTIRPAIDTALSDLADPGTDAARIDLTFRERAFWLFLTGHRQGDLRRLVRNYGRDPETVYPTGSYPGGFGSYGTEVTVPVPAHEAELNPHYSGCIHRRA